MDENGRFFIYFERAEVADMLGVGEKKASSLFNELEKHGLIQQEFQRKGTVIKIYVLQTPLKEKVEKRKYKKSKDSKGEKKVLEFKPKEFIKDSKEEKPNDQKVDVNSQKGNLSPVEKDGGHQSKTPYSNKEESNKEFSNNNNREMENNSNYEKDKKDVVVDNGNNDLDFDNQENQGDDTPKKYETNDIEIRSMQKKWIDTLKIYLKPGFKENSLKVRYLQMKELIETYGVKKIEYYLSKHKSFTYKKNPTGLMLLAIKNDYSVTETKEPEEEKQPYSNNKKPTQATNYEQREYEPEFVESLYDIGGC
jgi:hypothetical protein